MRYLVTGGGGQLARAFARRLTERGAEFAAPDKSELDITDPEEVAAACDSFSPNVILNCAAYNLVDGAQTERDKAFAVNVTGPGLLAREAKKRGALMVHFGSDYVFDGEKETGPYLESDTPNPLSVYGASKLRGESGISAEMDDFLIMRLSWVFGEGTGNFIHKLRGWARAGQYLKVSCDEFSVPTSAFTAADVTLKAIERGLRGLYHLTNTGYCSRFEWARLVLKELGIEKFIRPVRAESFDLPARRPMFSAMSNEKISGELGVEIPRWEDAVREFLKEYPNG